VNVEEKKVEENGVSNEMKGEEEEHVKNDENKPLNLTVHRAVNHIESLMTDMKSDCGRIPQTVQRIPPIAQRLQLSQRGFNTQANQQHKPHSNH